MALALTPEELSTWENVTLKRLNGLIMLDDNKKPITSPDGTDILVHLFSPETLKAIAGAPDFVRNLNKFVASGGKIVLVGGSSENGIFMPDENYIALDRKIFLIDETKPAGEDNFKKLQYDAVNTLAHELSHALYDRKDRNKASSAAEYAAILDKDEATALYTAFVTLHQVYANRDDVIEAYKHSFAEYLWKDGAIKLTELYPYGVEMPPDGERAYDVLNNIIQIADIKDFIDLEPAKADKIKELIDFNAQLVLRWGGNRDGEGKIVGEAVGFTYNDLID